MSMRQMLNKPAVGGALVALLAIIACGIYFFFSGSTPGSSAITLNYSVDDGKTYFQAAAQAAPFDYHGQQAAQVALFRCGSGPPFVGYLIRYADSAHAAVNAAYKHRTQLPTAGMQVKRPGDTAWTSLDAAAPAEGAQQLTADQIRLVKCSDGNYATQLLSD